MTDEYEGDYTLDAEIASSVYGWTKLHKKPGWKQWVGLHPDFYQVTTSVPHYSASTQRAVEIIEKCKDTIDVAVIYQSRIEEGWEVIFYGPHHWQEAYAPTFPLAVCRARVAEVTDGKPPCLVAVHSDEDNNVAN